MPILELAYAHFNGLMGNYDPKQLFFFYSEFQRILDHLHFTECKKSVEFKSYCCLKFECFIIATQCAIMRL